MLADGIGVPCGGFAAVDCIEEGFYGWLVKEESGFGVENGFQRTAPTKGDHGFPAGHGFYRGDAKVFFARQDESAASGVVAGDGVVAEASGKLDGLTGDRAEVGEIRSIANDHEAFAIGVECTNGEVDLFVTEQADLSEPT